MKVVELLKSHDACKESLVWVAAQEEELTLEKAWETAPVGDWLIWIAARVGVDDPTVTLATCQCIRASPHLSLDSRLNDAVKVVEEWARTPEPDARAFRRRIGTAKAQIDEFWEDTPLIVETNSIRLIALAIERALFIPLNENNLMSWRVVEWATQSIDMYRRSCGLSVRDGTAKKQMADIVRANVPWGTVERALALAGIS